MDSLTNLKSKILELKKIRDKLNSEINIETQAITTLEEKLSAIQRELDTHKQSANDKQIKAKSLNDKINASEIALNKLITNSEKLGMVLDEELKGTTL